MNARIIGTGYCLPKFRADNHYLESLVETSDEWIVERTGIRARHLVREETTVSMAAEAADMALERSGLSAKDIELLIVATITGDYVTPSTACQVQKELGAVNAAAFDINAACSGFLYALHIAQAFVESGVYRRILLIGAETLSKIVDWNDRGTCILFGDGAGAAVLEGSEKGGILARTAGSNGEKWEVLFCRNQKGADSPHGKETGPGYLAMDGKEVFKFAVKIVPRCVEEVLEKAGIRKEWVKYFLLHQANQRIIQSVAKRLGLKDEKFPINLDECGNTSAASLPILLAQMDEKGAFGVGDILVLSGFGAGLTWGACVVEW